MADSSDLTAVITGIGLVSPIGIGAEAFWASLQAGRSGVGPFRDLMETPMPVRFGAVIHDFDPKQHVKPRKTLKVMSREIQMAFAAAAAATDEAGIEKGLVDPDRLGVVFGSDMLYCDLSELEDAYRTCMGEDGFDYQQWGKRALSDLYPLWLLKYLPNMAACHVGIAHDARGHNNSVTLGEASGLVSLLEAVRVIERGKADVMIAGGTGSRLSIAAMMYRGDSNLSHRADDPAAASRPFDADRDGLVNGEGAGAIVVESRAHALARGATILAEVAGGGIAHEPLREDEPEKGSGMRSAITGALQDAGIRAEDLDHVNARGMSTVQQDVAEAMVIRDLLGDVPVTAPKSYFGSLGAGSGAVELAASVLGFVHGSIPPTLNYETPDPNCDINVIRGEAKPVQRSTALALNQAGTGQAVAVALRAV